LAGTYAVYPGNVGDVIGKAIVDGMIMDVAFNDFVYPDTCYSITKYEVDGNCIFAEIWKPVDLAEKELHKLSLTTFSAMVDGDWEGYVTNCAMAGTNCGLNMLIQGPMFAVLYSVTNDNVIEGDLGILRAKLDKGDALAQALCVLMEEGHRIYGKGADTQDLMDTEACKKVVEEFEKRTPMFHEGCVEYMPCGPCR